MALVKIYCLFSRDGQGAKVKDRPGAIQVICTAVVGDMYCYNSDASNDTDIFWERGGCIILLSSRQTYSRHCVVVKVLMHCAHRHFNPCCCCCNCNSHSVSFNPLFILDYYLPFKNMTKRESSSKLLFSPIQGFLIPFASRKWMLLKLLVLWKEIIR